MSVVSNMLLTSDLGPNPTTLKHAFDRDKELSYIMPSDREEAMEYAHETYRKLYKEVMAIDMVNDITNYQKASQKAKEYLEMIEKIFGYAIHHDIMDSYSSLNNLEMANGMETFKRLQTMTMAKEKYVDFSQNVLGINRMHPNFDSKVIELMF